MPYVVKVSNSPKKKKDKSKDSLIKSIIQANSLNGYLFSQRDININFVKFQKKAFLLVVTYKELYLNNGETAYEAFAREKIDDAYSNTPSEAKIPSSNTFFLDATDFDHLMSLSENKQLKISDDSLLISRKSHLFYFSGDGKRVTIPDSKNLDCFRKDVYQIIKRMVQKYWFKNSCLE